MKKDCDYKQKLSAFADQGLSARETGRISAHLKECEACRQDLKMLRNTDRLLLELPQIEPNEGFERSFWQKIDKVEEEKANRVLSSSRLLVFGWRPYIATAATALLIIGILNYYPLPFSGPLPFTGESAPEDWLIAEKLELYENMELIDNLDLLENWETIMSLPQEEAGYFPTKEKAKA